MTRWLVPLITLGCFCVLAAFSYGRYEHGHEQTYRPDSYTRQERDAMSRLVERSLSAATPVKLLRSREADAIAAVWNIKAEELDSPVDIFGEARKRRHHS